jgi:hypothetical protein
VHRQHVGESDDEKAGKVFIVTAWTDCGHGILLYMSMLRDSAVGRT